jgi:hypothetical protein
LHFQGGAVSKLPFLVDRALRRAMVILRGFAAILASRAERTIHLTAAWKPPLLEI